MICDHGVEVLSMCLICQSDLPYNMAVKSIVIPFWLIECIHSYNFLFTNIFIEAYMNLLIASKKRIEPVYTTVKMVWCSPFNKMLLSSYSDNNDFIMSETNGSVGL